MCCVTDWRGQVLFRFFFTLTFVLVLGFFPPFVLIKDSSGLCPVCTVCYRHHPAGTLVLLGVPAPIPAPLSFLQIWLDKGRRYKRRASIVLERSEPAEVGKLHRQISSYLIKTQNGSVSIFRALGLASVLSLKNHLPKIPHLV